MMISATEAEHSQLQAQNQKDDETLQPYYRAYLKAHGYAKKPDHEFGHLEFIMWVNRKHHEFRTVHKLPRHQPYSKVTQAKFEEFIKVERVACVDTMVIRNTGRGE